jgi:hypothetical protein
MRRILLILVTLLLLGGGFYLYLSVQKPPPQEARPRGFAETTMPSLAPPSTGPAVVGVGSGTDVAVKVFDRKTGALSYQFIAERYDPQADGSVNVTRPHARFYLGNGKVVALRGVDGRITMENAAANAQAIASGAAGGTPNRGNLRDVTIQLFDDDDDAEPSLTAVVPNASFDNDTLRIATEAQEIDGQRVAADQIPVRVRGRDVEFDGRGLLIRWEEGGQRLSLLEIAHGERLTLLRPGKLSTSGGLLGRATPSFPIGEALASADPAPATDQAVADRRKRRRGPGADDQAEGRAAGVPCDVLRRRANLRGRRPRRHGPTARRGLPQRRRRKSRRRQRGADHRSSRREARESAGPLAGRQTPEASVHAARVCRRTASHAGRSRGAGHATRRPG